MSTSDSFFEMAKTVQDTYSSGTMQGELYTLEKIKDYLNSVRETDEVRIIKSYVNNGIEDVQDRIGKTPVGKVLNSLTQ
jgi:hypothetical protein